MTDISSLLHTTAATTNTTTKVNGVAVAEAGENSQLSQSDFFSLLTQQLAYQDPSNPVDNAEMLSQMTAITTADGISQLNNSLGDLNSVMSSSMALQASALVGRQVLISSEQGYLNAGGQLSGTVEAPQSVSNLQLHIQDASGNVVKTLSLGDQAQGAIDWQWDGTDAEGNQAAAGTYSVVANAKVGNENQQLEVATYSKVDSVVLGGSGSSTVVNLQGVGKVLLSDVLEVAGS